MANDENGLDELRQASKDLREAVQFFRDQYGTWRMPIQAALPSEATSWNFFTFEKYINQRFIDLGLNLRERYEAQQTGLAAALAAAEKAVNAALIAAEKAVDKAEGAQQLRNEAQNEFRKSLGDLSSLMWTIKEGTQALESVRRELTLTQSNTERRVSGLENNYSNLQGRMWAVNATFAILVVAVSIAIRFVGH